MISDYEVWHTAVAMIKRYGTDAALQAGERSDRLTANGEIDESYQRAATGGNKPVRKARE